MMRRSLQAGTSKTKRYTEPPSWFSEIIVMRSGLPAGTSKTYDVFIEPPSWLKDILDEERPAQLALLKQYYVVNLTAGSMSWEMMVDWVFNIS